MKIFVSDYARDYLNCEDNRIFTNTDDVLKLKSLEQHDAEKDTRIAELEKEKQRLKKIVFAVDTLKQYNLNTDEYVLVTKTSICDRYFNEQLKQENEQLKTEIAELKKNAIVPKFKIGQIVWLLGDKTALVARVIGFNIMDDESENRYWVRGYLPPFNKTHKTCVPFEHISRTFCEPHIVSDIFATQAEAEQALAKLKGE